ncbi:MAG TPA: UDP-N-acetylmuramate dehydrogenase [Egibacteraceae bacterium]|nr:UDP-N-acetylmuramate dehydrogenase [Egibacteraceae bacterium]
MADTAHPAPRADPTLVRRLRERVSGDVLADEPLAAHTTIKVGGPAAALVRAETPADLAAVAELCRELDRPWLILGRGSNLLVADDGWPGVVVTLGRGFRGLDIDGETVTAGAAERMPALAAKASAAGLAGFAFGVAIPGSLGGAVRMNAGAHGSEMADVLVWADVIRLAQAGKAQRLSAADLRMGYRRTDLPADAVVVRAALRLRHADADTLRREMAEMKRWRRAHQPVNTPSCGSVFTNPPGDSAGRLIDATGMKGYRVGGARVSPVHANFITVEPDATAGDVHAVLTAVQTGVADAHGVRLQPEVVLVGFDDAYGTERHPWSAER